jgi:transcription initiation factor TFIIH subunit 1
MDATASFNGESSVITLDTKELSWNNNKVVIPLNRIKTQHVNKGSKALLRVTTLDGQVYQFAFSSLERRDLFKDEISKLINSLRSGAFQSRQTILAKDTKLRKLHRDLVFGGHLTEEEFWDNRKCILEDEALLTSQSKGISTEMYSVLSSSSASDVKYTLTPQIIENIFLHHPKIKQAYVSNVPDKLSEKEFWTRCLSSAFFYKSKAKDELFDKIAAEEQEEFSKPPTRDGKEGGNDCNYLVDLLKCSSDKPIIFNEESFDPSMKSSNMVQSLPIIRRLNKHGELVVSKSSKTIANHKILRDITSIDELIVENQKMEEFVELKIKDRQKYLENFSQERRKGGKDEDEVMMDNDDILENEENYFKAMLMIKEMKEIQEKRLSSTTQFDGLSKDRKDEYLTLHSSSNEILRHFWATFKVEGMEDKNKRMRLMVKKFLDRINSLDETTFLSTLKVALQRALNS